VPEQARPKGSKGRTRCPTTDDQPRHDPQAVRTVPTIASATLRHASRPIEMLRSRFNVPVLQLIGAAGAGPGAGAAGAIALSGSPASTPGAGPGGGAGCTYHGGGNGLFSL
jgi:hypothetical protein